MAPGLPLSQQEDKRSSRRKVLRVRAKVIVLDIAQLDARTIDISMDGVSLLTETPIVIGEKCVIYMDVVVGPGLQHLKVECKATNSVCQGTAGFRTGFQFFKLTPDSQRIIQAIVSS